MSKIAYNDEIKTYEVKKTIFGTPYGANDNNSTERIILNN